MEFERNIWIEGTDGDDPDVRDDKLEGMEL
jgi:hypothetical protein